jgi:hypothetical protein
MLFSGAWGKVIHEKTWSKKSRGTVPLISVSNLHHLNTDPDTFIHCNVYPDPTFDFYADANAHPASQNNADPLRCF